MGKPDIGSLPVFNAHSCINGLLESGNFADEIDLHERNMPDMRMDRGSTSTQSWHACD